MATKLSNVGTKLLSGKKTRDGYFRDRTPARESTQCQYNNPANGKGTDARVSRNLGGK